MFCWDYEPRGCKVVNGSDGEVVELDTEMLESSGKDHDCNAQSHQSK